VAFTDGSKGADGIGYGYAIIALTNDTTRATGLGSLDATAEVYDAEALRALRGLEKAIEVAPPTPGYTSASTTQQLAGSYGPHAPPQWVFERFHELADSHNVTIRWCPGHMNIASKETAAGIKRLATPDRTKDSRDQATPT
jgi:ribonuclease HI